MINFHKVISFLYKFQLLNKKSGTTNIDCTAITNRRLPYFASFNALNSSNIEENEDTISRRKAA